MRYARNEHRNNAKRIEHAFDKWRSTGAFNSKPIREVQVSFIANSVEKYAWSFRCDLRPTSAEEYHTVDRTSLEFSSRKERYKDL